MSQRSKAAAPKPASRSLTIDGDRYTLRYDFNAICAFEEHSGMPIMSLFSKLTAAAQSGDAEASGAAVLANLNFPTVRSLIYAGLLHEKPTISPKEAGDLVGRIDAGSVLERLTTAMHWVMAAINKDFTSETPEKK